MAPSGVTSAASTTSVLYIHPAVKLVDFGRRRGKGYVAAGRAIRRGELLLEERPYVWDSGSDPCRPCLEGGVAWLLQSGAVEELPCADQEYLTLREKAETVASLNAFRSQTACKDGSFPAMLFRATSRFNHSCFPNAGGHMPAGLEAEAVAEYRPQSLNIYAIDEVAKGEEICICYLSDADQLSPARARQASLEKWGFSCDCSRCRGARPLDRRLESVSAKALEEGGVGASDQRVALARANRDYRALFDPGFEEYSPPLDDFNATVERLNKFREEYSFLDQAHCIMQRVRRELIAAFSIDGPDGRIARTCARAAAALLVEEMQIQSELLPLLSPCKLRTYSQFLLAMKHVPPEQAVWLRREAKHDGCEQQHANALWLHDPEEARRVGAAEPRNLPPRPAKAAPPREGPAPRPGACCEPWLGAAPPWPGWRAAPRRRLGGRLPGGGWRRCRTGRTAAATSQPDEMPPLLACRGGPDEIDDGEEVELEEVEERPQSLWEAYGEYGAPTATARGLRGVVASATPSEGGRKEPARGGTWFKFKK